MTSLTAADLVRCVNDFHYKFNPVRITRCDLVDALAGEAARRRGLLTFLAQHHGFRNLWLARAVSFLGDSVGLIALLLYVADSNRSAIAVALLMLVGDFAPNLFSPIAGTIADRIDARGLMVVCEILQAVIVGIIALTLPGLPILLPLVGLRATVASVFQPASRAVVPALAPAGTLPQANAAIGLGTTGFDVFGPLLAAALLPLLKIKGLLVFDAATFAISAGFLLALPRALRASTNSGPGESFLRSARTGLAYIWQDRLVRIIAVGFCVVVFFNAVDDVALVYLAKNSFHVSSAVTSVLYAGVGAGLLAGFMLLGRFGGRVAMIPLLLAGYLVSSLGNLLTGVVPLVGLAFVMQFVRGIGLSGMDTGHNTFIQQAVPQHLLSRVFGNIYGAVSIMAGLSYVLGGLLLNVTSPGITLVVAGAGGCMVTAVLAVVLRGHRTRSPGVAYRFDRQSI